MFFFYLISADIISCVEFNHSGELLATGDKGGRVVIFQHDTTVIYKCFFCSLPILVKFVCFCFVLCVFSQNPMAQTDEQSTTFTAHFKVTNPSLTT